MPGFQARADLCNIGQDIFIYCQDHKVHVVNQEHNVSIVVWYIVMDVLKELALSIFRIDMT
jgi:hypothetical protein